MCTLVQVLLFALITYSSQVLVHSNHGTIHHHKLCTKKLTVTYSFEPYMCFSYLYLLLPVLYQTTPMLRRNCN